MTMLRTGPDLSEERDAAGEKEPSEVLLEGVVVLLQEARRAVRHLRPTKGGTTVVVSHISSLNSGHRRRYTRRRGRKHTAYIEGRYTCARVQ